MTSLSQIIDEVLGRDFTIECSNIVCRGRNDSVPPYFAGPGVISGGVSGPFTVSLHDSLEKDSKQFIELVNRVHHGLMMCFDATDYDGCQWTGGWLNPTIHGIHISRSFVTGMFPQLTADIPLTSFDTFRNSTANYYFGDLGLPMLEVANIQRSRGKEVERRSTYWDRTVLEFEGSTVQISKDEEKNRTVVSSAHTEDWGPPYCEVGLADAIGFTCATKKRPRITIRYFEDRAILFVRETPSDVEPRIPRPIFYQGPRDRNFWNLFLAFLADCKAKKEFDGTPLARLFSELAYASMGTIHVLVLSLVVAVDDLVAQITGQSPPVPDLQELKEYIDQWPGNAELKKSAIAVVSSMLSRTSTRRHLKELSANGVVSPAQIKVWDELRPKLAHGKVADYDEKLLASRNQLIGMVYQLAARLLGYKGVLADYTGPIPTELNFQWSS